MEKWWLTNGVVGAVHYAVFAGAAEETAAGAADQYRVGDRVLLCDERVYESVCGGAHCKGSAYLIGGWNREHVIV